MPVPVLGPLNGGVGFYELSTLTPPTFGGPTPQLKRLAMRVFTGGEIIYWPSPCGINCTYSVTFEGPAFDCSDSYNPTELVGDANVLYAATNGFVDPPSGYNYTNLTGQYQVSDGILINRTVFSNATFQSTHCKLHAATYSTDVRYTDNIPQIQTKVVLNEPILSSVFPDLVRMGSGEIPMDNRTMQLVNFYAIEQAIEDLLIGFLVIAQAHDSGGINGTSNIQLWNFVSYFTNSTPLSFPADFSEKIEELLVNTTLSLVYFLNNPLPPQTWFLYGGNTSPALYSLTNATIFTHPTLYNYSSRTLWIIYGISLGVSALCVIYGSFMLFTNGVDADLSFSQVLVTTRNASLDKLSFGACLGGENVSEEVLKTKLKFGELTGNYGGGYSHAGFGLEKEVMQIDKGKVYLGINSLSSTRKPVRT